MNLVPGSRTEVLAYNSWTQKQVFWMRLAKLIYLAIPEPPKGELAVQSTMKQAAANAYREVVLALFPELEDQQFDKEGELAAFLKERASKPFELRVSEGPRGNMDISLKP